MLIYLTGTEAVLPSRLIKRASDERVTPLLARSIDPVAPERPTPLALLLSGSLVHQVALKSKRYNAQPLPKKTVRNGRGRCVLRRSFNNPFITVEFGLFGSKSIWYF